MAENRRALVAFRITPTRRTADSKRKVRSARGPEAGYSDDVQVDPHSPDPLPPSADFGSSDLIGHQRFRHDVGSRASRATLDGFVAATGIRVISGDPTLTAIAALRFSGLSIVRLHTAPATLEWERAEEPGSNSHLRLLFLFVNRGEVVLSERRGDFASFDTGLHVVFPGSTPVRIEMSRPTDLLAFSFVMSEIQPLVLDREHVAAISANSAVFHAAYAALHNLAAGSQDPRQEDSLVLENLTRSLASAIVGEVLKVDRHPVYEKALAAIENLFRDPALGPDSLAQIMNVSRRTLDRAFEARGTSASRELRRRRAVHARRDLARADGAGRAEIAARNGFTTLKRMNQALQAFPEGEEPDEPDEPVDGTGAA